MTLIDFGDFKLRFDPKEVRISIDGEMIDVGARRTEEEPKSLNSDDYEIPPPGYAFIGEPPRKKKEEILPQTNYIKYKKFDVIGKDYFIDGKKQVKNSKDSQ